MLELPLQGLLATRQVSYSSERVRGCKEAVLAKTTSSENPYIATIAGKKESCHLNLPPRLPNLPRAVLASGTLTAQQGWRN